MTDADKDFDEHKHEELRLRSGLRKMAANLMRIARGAGNPYELEQQITSLSDYLKSYRDLVGHGVSDHIVYDCLNIRQRLDHDTDADYRRRHEAKETMMLGAIQVAASRLTRNTTQEIAGDRQMLDGVELLQAAQTR